MLSVLLELDMGVCLFLLLEKLGIFWSVEFGNGWGYGTNIPELHHGLVMAFLLGI